MMNYLSKLYQNPKQLFLVVSGTLFVMFALLLSPIVIARTFGTQVQLSYIAYYVEPGSPMYPELSIQSIDKDNLPPLLQDVFNSPTEEEAYEQLSVVDFYYLILDEVNGVYVVVDVVSTKPQSGVYIQTQSVYFDYNRSVDAPSDVWQDNYSGVRFTLSMNVEVYVPQNVSASVRQQIEVGTAIVDAYIYNGRFYFVDFNVS